MGSNVRSDRLGLRVGERVRVRDLDEILATLDSKGRLDALPFMPEMSTLCGREFRVYKSFHKYFDYVHSGRVRRVSNAVLLEDARCGGQHHGGCQALCLFIWKEAWLTRAAGHPRQPGGLDQTKVGSSGPGCTEADLLRATLKESQSEEPLYSCQATEVIHASRPPAGWWNPGPRWQDLRSGNVTVREMSSGLVHWIFERLGRVGVGYRLCVRIHDRVQKLLGGQPYPDFSRSGKGRKTPSGRLDLQPGELARVKSRDEILATLDSDNQNRGMWFDGEMLRFCGKTFPVLCRAERIIDNESGKMLRMKNSCLILESAVNQGTYHSFNPRGEYPFWREIWLERVAPHTEENSQDADCAKTEKRM